MDLLMLGAGDSTRFRLVYDAAAMPQRDWSWVILAGFAVVIGAYWLWTAGGFDALLEGESPGAASGAALLLFGVIGLGWAVLTGIVPEGQLRDALKAGQCDERDGMISDFIPGDSGDHVPESWVLRTATGNEAFTYSPSIAAPGYHLTTAHGGLLHDGMHVRLSDCHGRIGRLEIATAARP